MCSSSAPAPAAPDYSQVAAANEQSAQLAATAASNQLDFDKQQYSDAQPFTQAMEALSTQAANSDISAQDQSNSEAAKQWQQYETAYAPNENQQIMDAYGSQNLSDDDRQKLSDIINGKSTLAGSDQTMALDQIARNSAEGAATQATTQTQAMADSAFAQQSRQLARMGADPNKIAFAAANLANNQTANNLTAANTARNTAINQGTVLRSGVANFGRNMPNTAAQAYGTGTNAGNSAVASSSAAATANLPEASLVNSGFGSQIQAGQIGVNSALGMGSLLNGQYGIQSGIVNSQNQVAAGNAQGAGAAVGGIAAAALAVF